MKKTIFTLSGFMILGALIITSCKKKTQDPEPDPTPTTTTTGGTTTGNTNSSPGFTFTPNGGSATVADSAFYYQQYKTIHAYKNGNANHFEINLSALTVTSYSMGSGTGNALTYVMGATYLTASTGSLNITASANNKLSGNFNTTLAGGSISSVTGQFVDLPKR
ncbi:MAG: hypothetical protein V4506_08615 [Bacteroidota bacterium]